MSKLALEGLDLITGEMKDNLPNCPDSMKTVEMWDTVEIYMYLLKI